jgi:prevent-host-death family protein
LTDVTIYDYIETMTDRPDKTVKVAELKARLSAYLRAARRGHAVIVCERDTPVARLVPYQASGEPLTSRRPIRALRDVRLPPPLGRRVDSLAALLEERQSSR